MNNKNKMILAAVLLAVFSFGCGWHVRDGSARADMRMIKNIVGISDLSKKEMRELEKEQKKRVIQREKIKKLNEIVNKKFPLEKDREFTNKYLELMSKGDRKEKEKAHAERNAWREERNKFEKEQAAKLGIEI